MADVAPPRWWDRRHRGLFWAGLLVAALLVVGGAAYAYSSYRDSDGADGAVRGYLHALARGDAPAALSYAVPRTGDQPFLTSAVLRTQLALAPMHDITIGGDTPAGDGGTVVSFSYALDFSRGSERISDTVIARRVKGQWKLDRVAATVTLTMSQAKDRATLAGAAFPQGKVMLFPGAVPVRYDTPYLRLTLDTDDLRLGQTGDVTLETELTPAARTSIGKQLAAMLAACGRGGSAGWARCPLPDQQVVPGSMSGTMTAAPGSLTLSVDDNPSGSVSIDCDATFDGSYRELDFNDIARAHHGKLTIRVNATAYAVAPLTITFEVPS